MKKIHLIIPLFCLLFFAFTSIERATIGDTPGTLQAIGNAGSDQVFTFNKWKFTKAMMPEDKVENIQVEVEINTSSLSCDWKDLEKSVKKKKDYFYVKKFPKATVKIDGAKALKNGTYTTDAILTLKGISKTVKLDFSISDSKPYTVKGSGVIKRKKFNFTGGGPKNEVPINFEAVLPL